MSTEDPLRAPGVPSEPDKTAPEPDGEGQHHWPSPGPDDQPAIRAGKHLASPSLRSSAYRHHADGSLSPEWVTMSEARIIVAEEVADVDERVSLLKQNIDRAQSDTGRLAAIVAGIALVATLVIVYLIFTVIDQQAQITDQRAIMVTDTVNRMHVDESQRVAVCQTVQAIRAAFDIPARDITVPLATRYDTLRTQLMVSAARLRCDGG